MAMDTTGIINENEFYTDHYLRAILENDLKDVFSRWKEESDTDGSKAEKGTAAVVSATLNLASTS